MLPCNITIFWCLLFFIINKQVLGQESSEVTDRIINGKDAKIGERPYQVSLQNPRHFCGGSIINHRYIVTAAHCTVGLSVSGLQIVVGTVNLKLPYEIYKASKIIVNRQYSSKDSFKNDIALIKVSRRIRFSNRVKAVRVPELHLRLRPHTPVIVSGWGRLLNGTVANILQEVLLEVTDQGKCRRAVAKKGFNLYYTQMCADDNDNSIMSGDCNGDSGGPLTTTSGILVGIVSWSIKDPSCGSNVYPNIYTRVSEYIDWIREHMQ
ncbi:serine protease 43 isoform X1 [Nasonia vitripennis]|uniref:Peptidase S1 domain-containing protein n=1 Tax=Nasonia vitripennis TaxID=7425 RepID=A0A7M7GCS9_NASVI|nr:serine protease 43 isoform X1 [Nasonia vitripennis]XP_032455281.1 serine protease 43 isoform X1 [Nasonia vitripennis]